MPPKIILIRHGEAEHNATRNWSIPDPPLTSLGEEQCKELHKHLQSNFPLANEIDTIITSPFTRTVQTTLIGLDYLIKKGIRIEPDALWQENSDKPCDTGSSLKDISSRYPQIDFKGVDPTYPSKTGVYAFTRTAVVARGQTVLRDLYNRPEKVIAVVSHSGFLRAAVSRRHYFNADFRVFTFEKGQEGGDLRLIESDLTQGKGGMGWSDEGVAEIGEDEFPPEKEAEVVKEQQGERVGTEVTKEVP
ncbi:hypothetical protein B9Z65_7295 [Elsinoe australis]|uniref:Phosphoglycerate mutase-like protein n=1 Tax=Elsinoe australis TaxID=40998 RepID=A0A2P7Z6F9_9PEZI|nr:hypothetical protein B9Z65_7295 [Elsinoe australis]